MSRPRNDDDPEDFGGVEDGELSGQLRWPAEMEPLAPARPNVGFDGYPQNWAAISMRRRAAVNFKCERCGIALSDRQDLLQVHHIDRDKENNEDYNLIVLCVICHSKQDGHAHLLFSVSSESLEYLHLLRTAKGNSC